MVKLEETLRAKGYTDADIAALAPLLTNDRYRGDLESTLADAEYAAEVGRADSAEALRWRDEEALPKLTKAQQEAQDARAEAAGYRERMKALQEQGLIKIAEDQEKPIVKPVADFDPKKYNLVDQSDVARFAELEGDAIATVADLGDEYRELFPGKSLHTYVSRDGKSRGFVALRREAVAAKKHVADYVAEKFDFNGRRAEIAKAAKEVEFEAVRKAEREKVTTELVGTLGNPMARNPMGSQYPILPKPKDSNGKQPWEAETDRSQARVQKALTHVLAN